MKGVSQVSVIIALVIRAFKRRMKMNEEDINEMKRIIERHIPIGKDDSLCHVGICSIRRCERCKDAFGIRHLIKKLENENDKS